MRNIYLLTWPEIPDNASAHARDYLAIWPPNTQRKCVAEMKQNKIEQVLAYREQVSRCSRVLESFLRYSDKLLFINKCYWLVQCSILHRLEIQTLHPKQILIRHSRQHNRDIKSAAWSLEEKHRMMYYLTNFHVRCWFLRPANCVQKGHRNKWLECVWFSLRVCKTTGTYKGYRFFLVHSYFNTSLF